MIKPQYSKGAFLCLTAALSWGAMFPVMGHVLRYVDPFLFAGLRYGLAGIAFVWLLVAREGRGALSLKGERVFLAWSFGTAGFAGFGFLAFVGQQLAGPDGVLTAAIIMAMQPLLSLLVVGLFRRIAPPAYSFLFMVVSFAGIVLVITKGDWTFTHGMQHYGANVLILLGALCWVLYTVGATFFPTWSPVRYTTLSTLLGVASVAAITAVLYATKLVPIPTSGAMVEIIPDLAYMSGVAGFIGLLAWNSGTKILAPINAMLFINVVPLTAFVISALQGNVPTTVQIAGACLTAAALIGNNVYSRHRAAVAGISTGGRHTTIPVSSTSRT